VLAARCAPVQDTLSTPGPRYSTIAPVPPLTDRMPATLQMMSLGELHLLSLPVSFTPMTYRKTPAAPIHPLRKLNQRAFGSLPVWHARRAASAYTKTLVPRNMLAHPCILCLHVVTAKAHIPRETQAAHIAARKSWYSGITSLHWQPL